MARYTLLADHLAALPQTRKSTTLKLVEIEDIVGALPRSATTHQFWANAAGFHSTQRSWLKVEFEAFFNSGEGSVRFERRGRPVNWSKQELRLCVRAYLRLLQDQESGVQLNKSELRRRTLESLPGRTSGSYEFRMQNISAVAQEMGLVIVAGYRPAQNVGSAVKEELQELLEDEISKRVFWQRPTVDPVELAHRASLVYAQFKSSSVSVEPPQGNPKPKRAARETEAFIRDPNVVAYVKLLSNGSCEVCEQAAPFESDGGEPFLEVHHVQWLSKSGPDTIDNSVACCPNCHRAFHLANDAEARKMSIIRKVERLIDYSANEQVPE